MFFVGSKSLDFWFAKANSDGDFIWVKTFGGDDLDRLVDAVKVKDGYLLIGNSNSFDYNLNPDYTYHEIVLFRTDLDGEILSHNVYGDLYDDIANSLIQTTNNNYLISGNSSYLIKIDIKGQILWQKNYDVRFDLTTLLNNENYALVGFRELVKINPNGNILWEKTYGTGGLSDMKVTPDGGFIMVGTKINKDIYIVKTDANGEI